MLKGIVGSNDISLFSFTVGTVATEITRAGLWNILTQCHLQLTPGCHQPLPLSLQLSTGFLPCATRTVILVFLVKELPDPLAVTTEPGS